VRVQVIRHHAVDSPGFIADAFAARGGEVAGHLFPDDGPLPELAGIDHIVVLGSNASVYDDGAAREWIGAELRWLRQADRAGVPVLGICFGAQALAAALGGSVRAAGQREIGWTLVSTADDTLVPAGPWLEFHGDVCLPPAAARVLASNSAGVQAFSLGPHLAVQFHPEVDGAQLELWLANGSREEAERAGHDPDLLVAETVRQEPAARIRADQLVSAALRVAAGQPAASSSTRACS
jgi:GMP synthase-like glutamine amidotransferase